jgi:hypothetical protein
MEPFHPLNREPVWMSAEDSMRPLKSGDLIFVHSAAMCPNVLVDAMCKHAKAEGELRISNGRFFFSLLTAACATLGQGEQFQNDSNEYACLANRNSIKDVPFLPLIR